MRLLEVYFWVAVYWALYLPVSLFLYFVTEQGDPLGILVIGVIFTLILTIYLARQDDWLFETWEPAIVVYDTKEKPVVKKKSVPRPVPIEEEQPLEVENHVKEEKPEPESSDSARFNIGLEPWPKMRTDVDLGRLDADDDDILG